ASLRALRITGAPVAVTAPTAPAPTAPAPNQAPTVSLTQPGANAAFTLPATVHMAAAAADSDGSIAKVVFLVDGTAIGEDTTAPYTMAWSATAGSHALSARAIDNAGAATTSAGVPVNVSSPSVGGGLLGEYHADITLSKPVLSRTDATVDFDFGYGSPASGVPSDNFSVRWRGRVKPRYSQTYTFTTTSDDGIRLWIGGQALIDNWTYHGPTNDSGTIALVAGQEYDVRLEYFESGGGSVAKLAWSSPSQAFEIVPQACLLQPSATASAPTAPTASSGAWTATTVGALSAPGKATYSATTDTWTITGDGADIWGGVDAFQAASQPITGDVTVVARVGSLTNTDLWAKAGIMLRESTAPGAKNAFICVTPANGVPFQWREATDSWTNQTTSAGSAPRWLKLQRSGAQFTAWQSVDGTAWQMVSSRTLAMGATIQVMLAVTSHNPAAACTATFSGVMVMPGGNG
nr:hypothetical protein [Planctomycetota bacterium]